MLAGTFYLISSLCAKPSLLSLCINYISTGKWYQSYYVSLGKKVIHLEEHSLYQPCIRECAQSLLCFCFLIRLNTVTLMLVDCSFWKKYLWKDSGTFSRAMTASQRQLVCWNTNNAFTSLTLSLTFFPQFYWNKNDVFIKNQNYIACIGKIDTIRAMNESTLSFQSLKQLGRFWVTQVTFFYSIIYSI